MDKLAFNKLIENYISDSKIDTKRFVEEAFTSLERMVEDRSLPLDIAELRRLKAKYSDTAVSQINKGLDDNLFSFLYSLRIINNDHNAINEVREVVNKTDNFVSARKTAEKKLEEAMEELKHNIMRNLEDVIERDRRRGDDIVYGIRNAVESSMHKIDEEIINFSHKKLIDKLQGIINADPIKREVSDNEKAFITDDDLVKQVSGIRLNIDDVLADTSRKFEEINHAPVKEETREFDELGTPIKQEEKSKEVDELGTTIKKDNYYNKLNPERIKKGTYLSLDDTPDDIEKVYLNDDSCLLISINDMKTIYYCESDMDGKCVIIEDPSDYIAAAEKIMASDFYARYKKSVDLDQSLKPIFGRLEKELNNQKYRKGLRDLVGEKDYPKVLAEIEKQDKIFEESDNAKAFI